MPGKPDLEKSAAQIISKSKPKARSVVRGFPEALAAQKGDRLSNKWVNGWLLGQQGLGGATRELGHSVDPRTKEGLLNAMAMLVPGKPSGDSALAAHLGHSEFRPYAATYPKNDPFHYGGSMPGGGADLGYPAGNAATFRGQHGYSFPELLGLSPGKGRIKNLTGPPKTKSPGLKALYDAIHEANPDRMNDSVLSMLKAPYRTYRGMRN